MIEQSKAILQFPADTSLVLAPMNLRDGKGTHLTPCLRNQVENDDI